MVKRGKLRLFGTLAAIRSYIWPEILVQNLSQTVLDWEEFWSSILSAHKEQKLGFEFLTIFEEILAIKG